MGREGQSGAHPRGFTLIEMMVTIAVASVLLSIAVPSFRTLAVSNRLTTQANDMVAAINIARSEAIKRNSTITLCRVGNAATKCADSSADWQGWILLSGSGAVLRRGSVNTYDGGLRMRSTLSKDTIVFGPDGLASTGSALVSDHQISVCSPSVKSDNTRTIVLGAGSRISISSESKTC